MYGDVTMRLAEEMRKPEVVEYFTRLIMRVAPKSHAQAKAEVVVTRKFLENFAANTCASWREGFQCREITPDKRLTACGFRTGS